MHVPNCARHTAAVVLKGRNDTDVLTTAGYYAMNVYPWSTGGQARPPLTAQSKRLAFSGDPACRQLTQPTVRRLRLQTICVPSARRSGSEAQHTQHDALQATLEELELALTSRPAAGEGRAFNAAQQQCSQYTVALRCDSCLRQHARVAVLPERHALVGVLLHMRCACKRLAVWCGRLCRPGRTSRPCAARGSRSRSAYPRAGCS